ncbi:PRELI/MSF1 domain-containing protein [Plasmodiophora brassicae]|uniref:Phosphatidylinositol transfer protein N-terminal domain-containing protein n=1 Tax=Plasmodiophora brassicae TaxID=37360 RepID=A0A0G4J4Z9_PLABS|nr:hypothetical protein PBRA_002573 [Plasmodiophora brassicae]SPQ94738.1 unnamed protein product [Plasmodiophora brassicae]
MRLTEMRVGVPCTADQALPAYLYSFTRYVDEHRHTKMKVVRRCRYRNHAGDTCYFVERQYTLQIVPEWALKLVPNGVQTIERCFIEWPRIRSIVACPMLSGRLSISIDAFFSDKSDLQNVFGLDSNEIAVRRLIRANISPTPTLFVYKLFRISFNQFGLQKKLEEFIEAELNDAWKKMFMKAVDWKDQWEQLTIDSAIGPWPESESVMRMDPIPPQLHSNGLHVGMRFKSKL